MVGTYTMIAHTSKPCNNQHTYVAEAEMTASRASCAAFLRGVDDADDTHAKSRPLGNLGERRTMELAATLVKAANGLSEMIGFHFDTISIQIEAEHDDETAAFRSLRYRLEIVTSETERRAELLHQRVRAYYPAFAMIPPSCRVSAELVARQPAV